MQTFTTRTAFYDELNDLYAHLYDRTPKTVRLAVYRGKTRKFLGTKTYRVQVSAAGNEFLHNAKMLTPIHPDEFVPHYENWYVYESRVTRA